MIMQKMETDKATSIREIKSLKQKLDKTRSNLKSTEDELAQTQLKYSKESMAEREVQKQRREACN
uniref:hypothetical protein n=1 Tax=Salmonella sp. s54395 TaxID=3159664 RepID=UPI0039805BE0